MRFLYADEIDDKKQKLLSLSLSLSLSGAKQDVNL